MTNPTTSTDGTSAATTKSPWSIYLESKEAVKDRIKGSGSILIRGVEPLAKTDDDDDDDEEEDRDVDEEEEEDDPNTYTQAQVDHVRCIMLTKQRGLDMDQMEKLILGDQYGSCMLSFNTSFSWELLAHFETLKRKYKSAKSWAVKLNLLLGFTITIHQFDVWMHDHEGGWEGQKMIASLARMWKNTMQKTNDELEIDGEFTRPGLVEFLRTFKKEVEEVDMCDDPAMKFKFE